MKVKIFLKYFSSTKLIFSYLAKHGLLNWLNDETYLKIKFWLSIGNKLNLDEPKTFNEKLQWLKINYRKPILTELVDKYEVREYVEKNIGEQYLIPLLGVYDNFDDINFDLLPEKFALKCTHDSGGIVICRDKNKIDIAKAKTILNKSLKTNYYWSGREWPYKNVKPRIIAEQYMVNESGTGIIDYKFYCFNGEPRFLYVSEGLDDHNTAKITFLNLDWTPAPFARSDFAVFKVIPNKPKKYDEMLSLAKKLSKGHIFLRVDLYEICGKIYFSELTFTPCSGFMRFLPDCYDRVVGDMLDISIL